MTRLSINKLELGDNVKKFIISALSGGAPVESLEDDDVSKFLEGYPDLVNRMKVKIE